MNKKALIFTTILAAALLIGLQTASAYGYGSSYTHVKKSSYNGYYEKTTTNNPWGYTSHVQRFNYGPYKTHSGYAPYQIHYDHSYPQHYNHPIYYVNHYPKYRYSNKLTNYWHTGYHAPTYFEKTVVRNY